MRLLPGYSGKLPAFDGRVFTIIGFEPKYANNVVVLDEKGKRHLFHPAMIEEALRREPIVEETLRREGRGTATTAHEPLFDGVPSFFRARVREAQNRTHGLDYESAGWHFAGLLSEADDDEGKAAELDHIIDAGSDEHLLAFLRREYPRCLALIPPRRRTRFIAGVWRAIDEGRGR